MYPSKPYRYILYLDSVKDASLFDFSGALLTLFKKVNYT